jgi:nucleotide-binding universal stress UspA family protein
MILGSVSRHAAANAACPVVVVHAQPVSPRHEVVVGVRDPEDAAPALGRHSDNHRSGVRKGVAFVRHSVLGHAHGPVVIVPA